MEGRLPADYPERRRRGIAAPLLSGRHRVPAGAALMPVRMTVSTRSLSGLAANLLSADARAQKAIRATVARYGDKQFRLSRELVPVDTGFLRSQIRLRFS